MLGKRVGFLAMALGVVVMSVPPAVTAQTWETIFSDLPGYSGRAILVDPFADDWAPSSILVGLDGPTNHPHLLILDRSSGAFTFNTSFPGRNVAQVGFDSSSRNLFALSGNGEWRVRRSADRGVTWEIVDALPGDATAGSFAADHQGNVFVAGRSENTGTEGKWTVRKSSDDGRSWTTVDLLPNNPSFPKLHFVPGDNGGLFAVGSAKSGSGAGTRYSWLVRRSRDGGTTWQTVDAYAESPDTGARGIANDRSGNIYVAGYGLPSVVRRSTDGGDSWQTIHVTPAGLVSPFSGMEVRAMAVDPSDNLFLVGLTATSAGAAWMVHWRDSQGVWNTHLPFGTALVSRAEAVAIDRAGNVLVVGRRQLTAGSPSSAWPCVVQQLVVPVIQATRSGDSLVLSWSASINGAVLEMKDALDPSSEWVPVGIAPVLIGRQQVVNVSFEGAAGFYRLRTP